MSLVITKLPKSNPATGRYLYEYSNGFFVSVVPDPGNFGCWEICVFRHDMQDFELSCGSHIFTRDDGLLTKISSSWELEYCLKILDFHILLQESH